MLVIVDFKVLCYAQNLGMLNVMQRQSLKQKFIHLSSWPCVNPVQQRVHRGLRAGSAGMIDEKNHDYAPAWFVEHVTRH